MKVRVKKGMTGFYDGSLRRGADADRDVSDEFTIKEREHSTEEDGKGNPVIISVDDQFSHVWMEKVGGESESYKPKQPSEMKIPELKAALSEAGVSIPDDARKADLVKLLEDFQADSE